MLQNPTEVCKTCEEERFTFKAAGNADIHLLYAQNSCSLVQRNEQEYFHLMHVLLFTKISFH